MAFNAFKYLRLLLIAAAVLVIPVTALAMEWIVYTALGFQVNKTGQEVAAIAVERKDVSICRRLRHTLLYVGPTESDHRQNCVYEYARQMRDPEACASLFPTQYALACIGAAIVKPLADCHLRQGDELLCTIPDQDHFVQSTYQIEQIDNCEAYSRYNNRQVVFWCYAERAHRFAELEQCLHAATSAKEEDYCHYRRATMVSNSDSSQCNRIKNEDSRLGCIQLLQLRETYPAVGY